MSVAADGAAAGPAVSVAWHSTAMREAAGQAAGKLIAGSTGRQGQGILPVVVPDEDALASRTTRPVTFGWGPQVLHSVGQYHKGGPQNGVFLQITGALEDDVAVPGRDVTLGELQLAQALGDLGALRQRGRPAIRVHLQDRAAGVSQLPDSARATTNGATR